MVTASELAGYDTCATVDRGDRPVHRPVDPLGVAARLEAATGGPPAPIPRGAGRPANHHSDLRAESEAHE